MHAHQHREAQEDRRPAAREGAPPRARFASPGNRAKWVFLGFLALSALFLIAEHRAHLLGFLPWLILLLCPLMHIFMHGGHGHRGHGSHKGGNEGEGR